MNTAVTSAWLLCALTCAAVAQDPVFDEVALRVASLRPDGQLVVDRGRRDRVAVGDRVVLLPRGGQIVFATVREVDERSALVELSDRSAAVPLGSRGHVLVPKLRGKPPVPTAPAPDAGPGRSAPPAADQPPPTAAADPGVDDWRPGMPLLGARRPPHPRERRARATGRAYLGSQLVRTNESFSPSFLRAGAEVEVENVDGRGGTFAVHGEFDWSDEYSSGPGADLRLYEVRYARGGTRHEPLRWQLGRFLPEDMPEFGLVDGGEIGYRRENGDRFGASLGYLPELDDDLESLADLQISAWYLWAADLGERSTWGLGYQKTFHRGAADRDLLVGKFRWLPEAGWDLAATLWLDYYYGRDDAKGPGVGVTRAYVSTGRRWQGGGVDFTYQHEEYPEQLRQEVPLQLLPATLYDAFHDRLAGQLRWGDETTGWRLRGSVWNDEVRSGGSAELGWERLGLLQDGARTGLTPFFVQGRSNSLFGVRVDHGGDFSFGRLDLLYELAFVHHEGFPADRDDLLQHRLGALCTTDLGGAWSGTFHTEVTLWDEDLSFALGFYLQRSF